MAKTTGFDSQVYVEVGNGYRQRRVASVPFIVAHDRAAIDTESHILADMIVSENATSMKKAIFVAPCNGRILKVSVNAVQFPTNATGTYSIDVYKAVIGNTDVSVLGAVIAIDNATDNTAQHGTLSSVSGAIDIIEGQLVYALIAMSNNACTALSDGAVVSVEWRPTES